jgi:hypothetical protein
MDQRNVMLQENLLWRNKSSTKKWYRWGGEASALYQPISEEDSARILV